MKLPVKANYDMTTADGETGYKRDIDTYRKELRDQIKRCIKEPSYFAKAYFDFELYPYNKKYVDDLQNRWIIYRTGRKIGKSSSTAIKVLHFAWFANLLHKNVTDRCDILIVAPTQSQAQIMMDTIQTFAKRSTLFSEFVIRKTQTELEIAFFTGRGRTKIYTRAAGDTGKSVRGYMPHIIIVDEAAFVPNDVLIALIPAGMGMKANVWLLSTPFGEIGYFADKSLDANSPNPRWKEYHISSLENPEIANDPEYVQELKSLTGDQYEQEVLGNFLKSGDALIPKSLIRDAIARGNRRVPDNSRFYIGVDVARSGRDDTVFTLIAVDDNDKVYVIKTYDESQSTLTNVVQVMADWCRDYPIETIFVDETGLGAGVVDMAYERNIPVMGVTFSLKSKEEMYTRLRMLFENHRIAMKHIDKLVYQLSYLRREYVGGHMRIKTDKSAQDDFADSLALACNGVSIGDKWGLLKPIPNIMGG